MFKSNCVTYNYLKWCDNRNFSELIYMVNSPLLSIIIPVYNVEQYLQRCLDSVYSQDLKDFEVVAVNDCSTDSSCDILSGYQVKHNNIRIYNHPQNMGLMYARYTGYRNASGKYFVFLDSDDYLPTNALSILYNTIEDGKYDVVKTGYTVVDNNSTEISVYSPCNCVMSGKEYYEYILLERIKHNLWGAIYSRRLFDNITYETYTGQTNSEDLMLSLQLATHIKHLKYLNRSTYYYFENQESSSRKRFSDKNLQQYLRGLTFIHTLMDNCDNKELHITYLIKKISALLYNNYEISVIESSLGHFCRIYFSWISLRSRFNVIHSANYYLLYKSKFYRFFLHSIRPFINLVRR